MPAASRQFHLLCLLLLLLHSLAQAAIILRVPPQEEECFVIRAREHSYLTGNWDMLDDELATDPLTVIVIQPSNGVVYYRSQISTSEGTFNVKLDSQQKVAVCVQNGLGRKRKPKMNAKATEKYKEKKKHDGYDRTVGLVINVYARDMAVELKATSNKLLGGATDLTRRLKELINHHTYMRNREAKHRELVETTFSHLMTYTCLEAALVIAMALGQILYLRRFLERRRYMGMV
jgi:hypothetical protein